MTTPTLEKPKRLIAKLAAPGGVVSSVNAGSKSRPRLATIAHFDRLLACGFQEFLRVTREARSMGEILPFLPTKQQQQIRRRQQAWCPERASAQQELFARSEAFRGIDVSRLTRSPFESELSRYRSIATQVTKHVSTEKSGDQATLKVKTRSSDGTTGAARIVMVREAGDWKFATMVQDFGDWF